MCGFDGATALSILANGMSWSPVQTFLGFAVESDGVAILGDLVVLDGFQSGPDVPDPVSRAAKLTGHQPNSQVMAVASSDCGGVGH